MSLIRLSPVIRRTTGQDQDLPPRQRVANQRRGARLACLESAQRRGFMLSELPQDEEGVPLPIEGLKWSISHTKSYVGGVVFEEPVGFDVERVQHRREEIVRATGTQEEYDLFGGFRWSIFTRLWSAKEAVLKKSLVGLGELSRCRLAVVPGPHSLVMYFREAYHYVYQRQGHGHYASVCVDSHGDVDIHWDWLDLPITDSGPRT